MAALTVLLFAAPGHAIDDATLRGLRIDPSRATVPLGAVLEGGPPPQGIPALGFGGLVGVATASPAPRFVAQGEAAGWLGDREPVVLVRLGGEARLYPLQVLTWHEIANDVLGGVPIAVSYCPLCNSALVFDRRVPLTDAGHAAAEAARHATDPAAIVVAPDDAWGAAYAFQAGRSAPERAQVVTFGVSGLLYLSNLLMFDDGTFTLWSQLTGEAAVGALAGERLVRYGAQIVSFADARAAHPDALVLSRETGFERPYGRNPYLGYDEAGSPAFLFRGRRDDRLEAKARVVAIDGPQPVAYPFDHLARVRIVHDTVAGRAIVLFWVPGTATALGAASIADAADVGASGAFGAELDGRRLRFVARDDGFEDLETGSRWDVTGRAVSGPLAGRTLEPVTHDTTLWFAWAAFRPETDVRRP